MRIVDPDEVSLSSLNRHAVAVAADVDADLIAMATHGHDGFLDALRGWIVGGGYPVRCGRSQEQANGRETHADYQ